MFELNQVVPWGRSFDEYQRMFALTAADLRLSIIGCGDGPASFNAEATFPLLALGATPSPLVVPVLARLRAQGFSVSIDDVPYEFQRGGNKMMRIRRDSAANTPHPAAPARPRA